jgi:lysozyme family protein
MLQKIYDLISGIIGVEGGYVNDPSDAGGATKFGITERVARFNGYQGDMRLLPRDTAITIYYSQYIVAPGFDKVADISFELAAELIDAYVNMGAGNRDAKDGPIYWLQRWLNALNGGGTYYPDITVDGGLGKQTLDALRAFGRTKGRSYLVLAEACNAMQGARYLHIIEANASQERFAYGWLANRVGEKAHG